jgi:hypothetical protein
MKHRDSKICLDDITIQRYIDGEIAKTELENYNEHLKGCIICQQRVEGRKNLVKNVLDDLASLEQYDSIFTESHRSSRPVVTYLKFAASLFIVIGMFSWLVVSLNSNKNILEDNCKWVEIEDPYFHPDFVSPNRLYNMKAITIVETDSLGNHNNVYFEKKCYN